MIHWKVNLVMSKRNLSHPWIKCQRVFLKNIEIGFTSKMIKFKKMVYNAFLFVVHYIEVDILITKLIQKIKENN